MPSAARQRLPVDLWRQGHHKHLNGSPGPFSQTQEIQASPGDVFQEDKQQESNKHLNKSPRKQTHGRGSPIYVKRKGNANTHCVWFSDSESNSVCGRKKTVELSSAKSDSYISYNSFIACDAYAMESTVAPHPSEVPLPPLEWLQSSSKQPLSPIISDIAFKVIFNCHTTA